MKIHDQDTAGIAGSGIGRTDAVQSSSGRKGSAPAGGAQGDRVQISDLAQAIRNLTTESDERAAHLDRLSADYAAGRYKVDAGELSRKLIEDAVSRSGK